MLSTVGASDSAVELDGSSNVGAMPPSTSPQQRKTCFVALMLSISTVIVTALLSLHSTVCG